MHQANASSRHGGLTREDLARFGVDRIEVIDGPWRPAMPGNAITITTIEVD